MKNNLRGELTVMDSLGIKPNYAELGRKYGLDWRTVKKYHNGYKGKPTTRNKGSKLDIYKSEITDKLKPKSKGGGHPRYSYLEFSLFKRFDDVARGLINSFGKFGGVPTELLFDNMSTVANVNVKPKKPTTAIKKLSNDFNFKIRFCKARKPMTKGTVEAKNKVIDWIRAYEGENENPINYKEEHYSSLEALELNRFRENLDKYLDLIADNKKTTLDAIYELTELEIKFRKEQAINGCVKVANFPFLKEINEFDFNFQPSLDKAKIMDLISLRFIIKPIFFFLISPIHFK